MENTTFADMMKKITAFDEPRKWTELPLGDLAKSLVIEAAELLEHFQWDNYAKDRNSLPEKDTKEIRSEVADLFLYLFKFCREMNIDPVETINQKLEKIEKKFPVDYRNGDGEDMESYWEIKKQHRKNS